MTQTPDNKPPLPPLETLPGPPTQPGVYWFKSDVAFWAVMVEVRAINGQLMQYDFNRDDPVASLNGTWQGPLSTGPVSQRMQETKGLRPKGK